MVAMSVRDKHIVYGIEVNAHPFCIMDKHIASSRVKQNPMMCCL